MNGSVVQYLFYNNLSFILFICFALCIPSFPFCAKSSCAHARSTLCAAWLFVPSVSSVSLVALVKIGSLSSLSFSCRFLAAHATFLACSCLLSLRSHAIHGDWCSLLCMHSVSEQTDHTHGSMHFACMHGVCACITALRCLLQWEDLTYSSHQSSNREHSFNSFLCLRMRWMTNVCATTFAALYAMPCCCLHMHCWLPFCCVVACCAVVAYFYAVLCRFGIFGWRTHLNVGDDLSLQLMIFRSLDHGLWGVLPFARAVTNSSFLIGDLRFSFVPFSVNNSLEERPWRMRARARSPCRAFCPFACVSRYSSHSSLSLCYAGGGVMQDWDGDRCLEVPQPPPHHYLPTYSQ